MFFYGTDFDLKDLPKRRNGQDWALLHEESPKNNALFNFDSTLRLFNHTATFRSASDLPLGTLHLDSLDSLVNDRYLIPPEEKRVLQSEQGLAPVIYIQSACDCPSRRDDLVRRLSEHISIDSYGACLNNKTMPEPNLKNQAVSSRESLLALLAKYKFVLALENAECPDYVTEKLWNALTVGSVPVYFGAPNVAQDYLPRGKASAIPVSDFDNIKELADKLKTLDADDVAYKRMLGHKRRYANADGTPIKNKKLIKSMTARKWGVTDKDQMDKGSYVNHFECLVCQRLNERDSLIKAGFGEAEPRQADLTHYGCPYPKGALSALANDKLLNQGEKEGLKLWQDLHTDGFVKSVYLSVKVEKGETVTEEGLAKLFGYAKVALIEEEIMKVGEDRGRLKALEEDLRRLINEENL